MVERGGKDAGGRREDGKGVEEEMKERKEGAKDGEKCFVLVKQMFVLELLDLLIASSCLACHRRLAGKELGQKSLLSILVAWVLT